MKTEVLESDIETYKHVNRVRELLNIFVKELIDRAQNHDKTKFESPEREVFGANFKKLAQVEFGSEEYKECLKSVQPAIDHHYSKNRHHPQFWKNGVDDMTLVDLLEMLVDWKAATDRNRNGNIRKSLDFNAEKYAFATQLKRIFANTITEYFD